MATNGFQQTGNAFQRTGNAFQQTDAAVVTGPRPAGKASRRKRYYVEVDGQQFFVDTEAQARSLLEQARAIAERQAEERSERVAKQLKRKAIKGQVPKVEIKAPEITVSPELRDLIPIVDDIKRLYAKAAELAELRLLMLKALRDEQDDEDDLLLLL